MSNELAALWATVEAAPPDQAPKLILADWLQERDRDPALERGLRWCAAHGKWPLDGRSRGRFSGDYQGGRRWRWCYLDGVRGSVCNWRRDTYRLPLRLWLKVNGSDESEASVWGDGVVFRFDRAFAARAVTLVRRLGRALGA
jgi:uncharacterized protein (TIGR02996 family)